MIMLHSGLAEKTLELVYGYALRENENTFIVCGDGTKIKVREETVLPYKVWHRIEDYLCPPKGIMEEFHNKGLYYLEDIAELSDDELEKIRGIGEVRRKEIQRIVKEKLKA